MPEDAPRSKMEATRSRGATIVTYNRFTDSREEIASRILAETGATLVPPFDHAMIMAGQAPRRWSCWRKPARSTL
jgi:threonine dehydratase